jgi:hypothetical protein
MKMPVRSIIPIGKDFDIRIPHPIRDAFDLSLHETFVCEFKRHFDEEKNLIREINETVIIYTSESNVYISLTGHNIAIKYGFLVGEYIEIIFKKIKRRIRKDIQIFPERIVDYLAFVPDD